MNKIRWDIKPDIEEPWMKFWPENVNRHMEYYNEPYDFLIKYAVENYPDSDAVYFEGYRCNYKELNDLIDRFARGLVKLGVKKGDVILIDLPNSPQFVISIFAAARIGAISSLVVPLNRYAEILYQANDSGAKYMIILDSLYEEMLHGKPMERFKTIRKIILTGVADFLPPHKAFLGKLFGLVPRMKKWPEKVAHIDVVAFKSLLKTGTDKSIEIPEPGINPREDPAVLVYTGGTTGTPKGVMLTHFNLLANTLQGYEWVTKQLPELEYLLGKGGILIILPLSHSFGLTIGMNIGIMGGLKLVLLPRPPKPIRKILDIILKENVLFCPGVPTLWNRINMDPKSASYKEKLKKSNFIACLSGAAPLPPEVKQKFEELTGSIIIEGYGMSEASPLVSANPFKRSRISVGIPMPDTYFKIVDPDKGERVLGYCPYGPPYCPDQCDSSDPETAAHIGEICVCGPQVMKGYFNNPDETARALRKDEKGVVWYYTSDIGCIDSEGYIHIKDRKRDMIKYKGHAVFPREIEDLMYQYDPIKEVGVFGVRDPDPEIGEQIHAVVSLKEEYIGKITEDDILEWCKNNIAPYKYPRYIRIVDEVPKSLIGKVLRRVLREKYGENIEKNKE